MGHTRWCHLYLSRRAPLSPIWRSGVSLKSWWRHAAPRQDRLMALASSLKGGASSVSHHVGITYGLEHFRVFCFVSRPLPKENFINCQKRKLKKRGGALQRQSIFASTICRFFILKKRIYKNKSPPQAGRIFVLVCFPEVAWHMLPVEGCYVPGVGAR